MYLQQTDVLALIIALAGSAFVIVTSIRAYGKLMRENKMLRKELAEREWSSIKGR